ncbi:MAG: peptide MFS transporter [Bacteroidota bacterium]|nr:peptide MFS transporter [Bacteroidota bacterium]
MSKEISQKHPPALYLLAATAAGERFSYYGMRALLMLYMTHKVFDQLSGMNFSDKTSGLVYGLFNGLCYLFPFFGGIVADRLIGERRSVTIGGVLIFTGLLILSINNTLMPFITGLTLIAVGNGFFKPTVVAMIGDLYQQGDSRRDSAFTIYYQLFNGAVFLAPIICGAVAAFYGYRAGFMLASVAVVISMVSYWILAPGVLGAVGKEPKAKQRIQNNVEVSPLTKEEKDRISVIFVLLFFVTFFWAGYEQAGSSMTLFTEKYINRNVLGFEIQTPWFQSVNPLLVLLLGFPFSYLWIKLSKIGKNPSTPIKMGIGMIFLGIGFLFMLGAVAQLSGGAPKASMLWLIMAYLFHTIGELMLSPIGLSMVTKLAPAYMVSMFMGVWFLSSFLAHVIGGVIASFIDQLGPGLIFGGVAGFVIVLGFVVFLISGKLLGMMHGRD